MRNYQGGWDEYRFEVEKIAEVGPGKIVGLCRERGREGDGIPVDRHYGGLWIVDDSKIASWATYLTPKEAVKAARELAPSRFREERAPAMKNAGPPARNSPAAPKPRPVPAEPKSFSEAQRDAAKRRAALARAAREGGRRAPTG